jgi:hypothetical protein
MHEPITVEVGGELADGTYDSEEVSFTGSLVQVYESDYTTTSLYEWLDRGYVVYMDEDRPGALPHRTLLPLASPRKAYTAEEVARMYPRFANEVGLTPKRDIDFE